MLFYSQNIYNNDINNFVSTWYLKQWDIKAKQFWPGNLVLSGMGTSATSTFGLRFKYSYATPHSVIASYRSPDSGAFDLIVAVDHAAKTNFIEQKYVSSDHLSQLLPQ